MKRWELGDQKPVTRMVANSFKVSSGILAQDRDSYPVHRLENTWMGSKLEKTRETFVVSKTMLLFPHDGQRTMVELGLHLKALADCQSCLIFISPCQYSG